jgi:hypothetical protein
MLSHQRFAPPRYRALSLGRTGVDRATLRTVERVRATACAGSRTLRVLLGINSRASRSVGLPVHAGEVLLRVQDQSVDARAGTVARARAQHETPWAHRAAWGRRPLRSLVLECVSQLVRKGDVAEHTLAKREGKYADTCGDETFSPRGMVAITTRLSCERDTATYHADETE